MKKSLVIFIFCFLFNQLNIVSAQNGGFLLGLDGAFNLSLVVNQQNYGQKEMDYDGATFRPAFGAFIGYDFNGRDIVTIGGGLMSGGQKYNDTYGNGDNLKKDIQLNYLSIPLTYKHVFTDKEEPYSGSKFYISVGPQFDLLQSAEVTHAANDQEVSLQTFANFDAGGNGFINFNSLAIQNLVESNGSLNEDKELFQDLDIKACIGLGTKTNLSEKLSLDIELRGGVSVDDINSDSWRLDGFKDGARQDYEASRNAFGGIRLGLSYRF